jgi:DNA-binding SARP family transcriptional activator
MQQVIFRLLGPPEIRYKEQLVKIPRRRSRALLYYMVCTHTPQPRERLLALLCGEIDEESARHTFKTLLAEVRALLRGFDSTIEWIVSEGDQLTLNPLAPVWLDTEVFEKATATTSRNLNRAINLYRGDFLDGFFLKDSSGFEAWVRSTRDHFHHLYLSALRHLAELYESEGQLEQAITCTQMLLNADPLLEEAHARLMRLCWTAGDRVEALRQYERLCIVLDKELAVKPLASTQALYAQIAHSSKWPPAAKSSSSPVSRLQPKQVQTGPSSHQPVPAIGEPAALPVLPFVGRTKELAWLQGQLTGPANHHPLLLIQGEAGIGKTRLIQETLRRFCSSWIILQGTCQEIEREQPYHAIIEALRQGLAAKDLTQLNLPRPWLTQIAQLLPDLLQSDATVPELSPIEPIILADALVALFNQLAHPQRPLLLVLDDLHWADTTTLALLGHLVRHTRQGSVFLLGAFCNAIAGERLAPLRQSAYRQHALAELAPSPLQPEDISELATLFLSRHYTSTGRAKDSEFLVNWCCQRSEGNPFFAVEWLSLAVRERGAGQNLSDTLIPEPVETLIKNQLGLLSHDATSLLTAAAFLGMSFNLLTAAALVDFDKRTTIAASDELIKREFVVETPAAGSGYYTFTHRAVRDVLLSTMSTMQRHLLHQLSKAL